MTENEIKRLPIRPKRYKTYLGRNLYLETMPTGRKLYRIKRKSKTLTLGESPYLTFKHARMLADEKLFEWNSFIYVGKKFKDVLSEWLLFKEWAISTRRSRELVISK